MEEEKNLGLDLITTHDLDRYLERYDKQPTCDYTIREHLFNFDNYGKSFTQVAIVLEPSHPLHVNGKKVYFVASEGGHDNSRELIYDNDKEEAIGPMACTTRDNFHCFVQNRKMEFLYSIFTRFLVRYSTRKTSSDL